MSESRRAVRVLVRGRVHHVGFRWFVARAARNLAVTGWVRNAEDGTVELAAEGGAEQVEQLLAAVRRGPSQALVQSVEIDERPPSAVAHHTEFEILP